MTQYIDKSTLSADIDKRKNLCEKIVLDLRTKENKDYYQGKAEAYSEMSELIDTLEVKEVDLDFQTFAKEMDAVFDLPSSETKNTEEEPLNWEYAIAKYFFKLGLKAKDWEKERMEECPYRQVGCTMYEGKILECRGACSWVVDYPKLKELKAKKVEEV